MIEFFSKDISEISIAFGSIIHTKKCRFIEIGKAYQFSPTLFHKHKTRFHVILPFITVFHEK